jgi:hypothetical protein
MTNNCTKDHRVCPRLNPRQNNNRHNKYYSEILTAVTMVVIVFSDMAPCSLVHCYRRSASIFRVEYSLNILTRAFLKHSSFRICALSSDVNTILKYYRNDCVSCVRMCNYITNISRPSKRVAVAKYNKMQWADN